MVSAVISWPTVELPASISAAAPLTVTTSLTLPTFSVMFTVDDLVDCDRDVLFDERFESLGAGRDLVSARSKRDERIQAGRGRHGGEL